MLSWDFDVQEVNFVITITSLLSLLYYHFSTITSLLYLIFFLPNTTAEAIQHESIRGSDCTGGVSCYQCSPIPLLGMGSGMSFIHVL